VRRTQRIAEAQLFSFFRLNEAEWGDAAIIRGGLGDPGAAVYLKYDQDNLWVGVRCFETAAGYPKAYVRKPTVSVRMVGKRSI
jgi:hypothetical protein